MKRHTHDIIRQSIEQNVRTPEIDRHINKTVTRRKKNGKIDFDLLEGSFV